LYRPPYIVRELIAGSVLRYGDECRILVTALHGMQTRSSDQNSVCLSVRPSVKRLTCDKTKDSCAEFYTT